MIAHNGPDVGIVVVGCQEVEIGAGILAMPAAKETSEQWLCCVMVMNVEMSLLVVSSLGQWWQDAIGKTLDKGRTFIWVGSRQLGPLLIGIWVRKTLRTHVGDLDVAAVACGLGRAIGYKTNTDFEHIFRTMAFPKTSPLSNTSGMLCLLFSSLSPSFCTFYSSSNFLLACHGSSVLQQLCRLTLRCFMVQTLQRLILKMGNWTYQKRIWWYSVAILTIALFGISYDEARDFISQRTFDWLREIYMIVS